MSAHPHSELSANQQSMLDLALGCDLKVSQPSEHVHIRARHKAIKTQVEATKYIREVETKIHSKRKFNPLRPTVAAVTAAAIPAVPGTRLVAPLSKTAAKRPVVSGLAATFYILAFLAFMVVAGWFFTAGCNLIFVMASMIAVMVMLGLVITKRPLGILVNDRNLMSLSRFQMVLWTVVILSSYLTFAFVRIKAMAEGTMNGQPLPVPFDPLNIVMDWHLWALLGISTTSLVGAPLILSTKKDKTPDPDATAKAAQMVNEPFEDVDANKQGTLYANTDIKDAQITDMFQGDELNNTAQIDLAKVQMFYFTIIAALCFFVMVFRQLVEGNSTLGSLPLLPDGFVAILGISHGGYLASKTINHTKSVPG